MDTREKVIDLLNQINPQITTDTEVNLLEAGYIDSFEVVNIVMEIEDAFGIEIDPEDIIPDNFQTISSIVSLVEKNA